MIDKPDPIRSSLVSFSSRSLAHIQFYEAFFQTTGNVSDSVDQSLYENLPPCSELKGHRIAADLLVHVPRRQYKTFQQRGRDFITPEISLLRGLIEAFRRKTWARIISASERRTGGTTAELYRKTDDCTSTYQIPAYCSMEYVKPEGLAYTTDCRVVDRS